MTIIEQIKAEIERLKEHTVRCGYPGQDEYAEGNKEGRNFICDKLLFFLSTLESEKPMQKNLNDEIKKYIEEYGYERGADKLLIAIVARHFAEWQKEQMMKEAVEGEIFSVDVGDDSYVKKLKIPGLLEALRKFNVEDKVRIIILPKED